MKKLSAYTVASNCTDLTDIRDGIAEIHEAMKTCVESGKHIPSFYVSRLAKLETKKKKLEKRTQVHMTVTIRFFIASFPQQDNPPHGYRIFLSASTHLQGRWGSCTHDRDKGSCGHRCISSTSS
jgi:hypothetical protein